MIQSILLKDVATYNSEGIVVENLAKVNFIYGSNGCGKTTISNFVNTPTADNFSLCDLQWKNQTPLKTLVYNKNFREQNFGKGKLNGIFTLGKATTDEIKVLEDKKIKLKGIEEEGIKKNDTIKKQGLIISEKDLEFRENCWINVYKKYEIQFKEAFKGVQSKDKFRDKILEESKKDITDSLPLDTLQEQSKLLFGETPQSLELLAIINNEKLSLIEFNPIWGKKILGKSDVGIAKLIQKLNINDWVNQGRNYLTDSDDTCPFCQQSTINEKFKSSLEDYFDKEFQDDTNLLKTIKEEYTTTADELLNDLEQIISNPKTAKDKKLDLEKFIALQETIKRLHSENKTLIESKIKEPSRSIELQSLVLPLKSINELITKTNELISEHNRIVANITTEKTNLINAIWIYIVVEFQTAINQYTKEKAGLEKGIQALNKDVIDKREKYKILDAEIRALNKNVTSIQPTIDEINRLLKSYGFQNFEICAAPENGFYHIKRENGEIAETTLSEGEVTFITFLYFLQLAKGANSEEEVDEERVLVIDDPISSLDSNILFVVSTLIKEMIKAVKSNNGNIKQIIILTHNVYFHKEVSYEGLNRKGEKSLFWILRKNNNISKVHFYGENNPIQSSYELLWREIKEWENNSGITIQNALRRILENYFSILGNKRDDTLINHFPNPEDKEICRSLLSWSNEGSHTLPDDLYIEIPDSTIEAYLHVFKNIFIHTQNIGHYNMMMEIDE